MNIKTYNYFTDIATIKRPLVMVVSAQNLAATVPSLIPLNRVTEVLMTRALLLRSRVMRKYQARF
ncbi:hypothetical protein [Nostoc sp.]|uniref:hypothetical protein n=1 Tax=Nostoc sp. TaxID=1180 RepID=UPI002FF6D838